MKQSNLRSFRHPSACILVLFALLVLVSCQQPSVREQEQIANLETILAGTPSVTPTFTPTPTYTPTITPSPTVGPTLTPSPTLSPTVTPFPPTPTTNPALQGFSFCNQEAGSVGSGRFSASLGEIDVRGFPAFERITVDFALAQGSAPLSATANCLSERDFTVATNEPIAPSPYILQVNLPNWLQDDTFRDTRITETLTFTETRMVESMDLRFDLDDAAGATFVIGLKEPVPYRLTLSDDPLQIQIEVARSSPLVASSDQLTIPAGTGAVQVPQPLFFLLDGDVWQISSGQTTTVGTTNRTPTVAPSATAEDTPTATPAEEEDEIATPAADEADDATPAEEEDETATPAADETENGAPTQTPTSTTAEDEDTPAAATAVPTERTTTPAAVDQTDDNAVNLTNSPEEETALAVSPDGTRLAFCRATPGASLSETAFAVSSTLWTMNVDGTDLRQIPFSGVSCGDLAFSPDGQSLAFSVNESVVPPDQRSIWIAVVDDGTAQRVAGDKEWSRAHPQWLGDEALLYNASAQDGRSTLFLLSLVDDRERDVGAEILVNEQYTALGQPLAAPNGRNVAIEAIRTDEDGADLLLLDANGVEQDVIDEGYWARPLAWDDDGTLYYMTTACASTLIQDYTLYRRTAGRDQVIAAGQSLGAIGDGIALVESIAYVASSRAQPGSRGQNAIAPQSASTIWFWDLADGGRGELYNAERGVATLTH